jgi:2-dehydro-3-deoxygalactonokinase
MIGIIDCGTTNTRVYILNNQGEVVSKSYKKVGVRDTSISGSRDILKAGLKEAFLDAVGKAGLTLEDIEYAVASGMITSEIGLIDLPHLIAPAGIAELSENVKVIYDEEVFPLDLPIVFIRGIKNNYGDIGISDIRKIDFMRGEETQVMGLLKNKKLKLPMNVIVLSSHTKLIHINAQGQIAGSITTISGQIYEAIRKETIIGSCIKSEGEEKEFFSKEILQMAYDSVQNAGFLRTMIMPRFMQVLLDTEWYEREFFTGATIAAEDIQILNEAQGYLGYSLDTDFVLVGQQSRCKIYEELIREKVSNSQSIQSISDKEDVDALAIEGVLEILKELNFDLRTRAFGNKN